jgi:DNA-binding IscR family transcriptional regulator
MGQSSRFPLAVHVLVALSFRPKDYISSDSLSGTCHTNPVVVRRIVASLKRAGFVVSQPGVTGGVRLAKLARQISLLDVYRAVGRDELFRMHNLNKDLGTGERATSLALQRLIEEHLYWTKSLHLQGLGRHSQEDIYRLACDDLAALSASLGSKQYFFGDKPTDLDATAYGFLAQVLWAPGARRSREHMEKTRNLPAFCERIKGAFYGGNRA